MISFCNNLTSYLVFWLSLRFDILQLFTIILDASRSNLHSSWIYHSRMTMKVDETRNLRNELQFIYWISSSRVRDVLNSYRIWTSFTIRRFIIIFSDFYWIFKTCWEIYDSRSWDKRFIGREREDPMQNELRKKTLKLRWLTFSRKI